MERTHRLCKKRSGFRAKRQNRWCRPCDTCNVFCRWALEVLFLVVLSINLPSWLLIRIRTGCMSLREVWSFPFIRKNKDLFTPFAWSCCRTDLRIVLHMILDVVTFNRTFLRLCTRADARSVRVLPQASKTWFVQTFVLAGPFSESWLSVPPNHCQLLLCKKSSWIYSLDLFMNRRKYSFVLELFFPVHVDSLQVIVLFKGQVQLQDAVILIAVQFQCACLNLNI